MALDPKLYARLQQRQRAKKAQAMGTIGSIITQEGIDYQAPWKRLQEKQALMEPSVSALEQSTQFYFGKEYEAQQNALNKQLDIKLQNLQAALTEGQMDVTSSSQTSRNQQTAILQQIKTNIREQQAAREADPNVLEGFSLDLGMDPAQQAAFARASAGGGGSIPSLTEGPARDLVRRSPAWQEIDRSSDKWYEAEAQRPETLIGKQALRLGITDRLAQAKDDAEAQEIFLKAWAEKLMANNWLDRGGALGATPEQLEAARQETEAAQKAFDDKKIQSAISALRDTANSAPELQAGTVQQIARATGVPEDVLLDLAINEAEKQGDADGVSKLLTVQGSVLAKPQELATLDAEGEQLHDDLLKVAGVGYGKDKIRAALSDLQTTLTQLQKASNLGKPVSEEDERTNNFYNILAEPQGPAADKRLEMLQAIEEYEDLPSAQSIKGEIFASPEFQKYMEERQVYDPDIAFKLMNREARAMKQASRSQSRQRVRQLVKEGQLSRQDAESVVETPEAPETPAAQAVADAAADKVAGELAGASTAAQEDQKKKNP
jgi:hypothetical protein